MGVFAALLPFSVPPALVVLGAFVLLGVVVGLLWQVGLLGLVLRLVTAALQWIIETGYALWARLFAWAPWPVLLVAMFVLHAVALAFGEWIPLVVPGAGLVLLALGVTSCLAYILVDQERYEVSRGYKVLHNPLAGQGVARALLRHGQTLGVPMLIAASLASISGFALLNEGLYNSFGRDWYRLGRYSSRMPAELVPSEPDLDQEPAGYSDFLAYTLVNLTYSVDVLDLANSSHIQPVAYVHPVKWPSSTLLLLFRTFFVTVLLQQLFSSIRLNRLLTESIQDVWSPHEPIQRRAWEALTQQGVRVVRQLLGSVRTVEFLTAEQRQMLPEILAQIGPSAVPYLVLNIDDPNENVRLVVVSTLGRLQALAALPPLLRAVRDPSEAVRQSLAEALETIFSPGVRAVQKQWGLTARPSLALRGRARRLWPGWLRRQGKDGGQEGANNPVAVAVEGLRLLAADPARPIRMKAAQILGQLGPAAVVARPEMERLLHEEDEALRVEGVRTLVSLGVPADVLATALTPLLDDPSAAVRAAAADGLGAHKKAAAAAAPELIALVQDQEEEVRQAAAEAVRRIGALDGKTLPQLLEGLRDPDPLVRAQAAEALGTIGPAAGAAVDALARLMHDVNDRVRGRVVWALGQIKGDSRETLTALITGLRDQDHRVAGGAAEALGALGPAARAALPSLVEALRHINPEVRQRAIDALVRVGAEPAEVVRAVGPLTRDEDNGTRGQALRTLGAVQGLPDEALPLLRTGLEDGDPLVRAAAAEALGGQQCWREAVLSPLVEALNDPSEIVRAAAAQALGRLGTVTSEGVAGLIRLLGDGSTEVQARAAAALTQLEPPPLEAGAALLQAFQTGEAAVREEVLRGLVQIQPPEMVAACLRGLHDTEGDVRRLASAGLMKAGRLDPALLPSLSEGLKDPDVQVRSNVACVLGQQEELPAEVVPLLVECTTDPDDGLRLHALRALGPYRTLLGDVLPRLVEDSNPQIALLASGFLLSQGGEAPQAAEVLTRELSAPTARARKQAAEILESLGERAVEFKAEMERRLTAEDDDEVRETLHRVRENTTAAAEPKEGPESDSGSGLRVGEV
jgi:HEAT repeat protein